MATLRSEGGAAGRQRRTSGTLAAKQKRKTMTTLRYRGYTIEVYGSAEYLIKTAGIYGYHYFKTIEAAKAWIEER
jgi:hypothetical protein